MGSDPAVGWDPTVGSDPALRTGLLEVTMDDEALMHRSEGREELHREALDLRACMHAYM